LLTYLRGFGFINLQLLLFTCIPSISVSILKAVRQALFDFYLIVKTVLKFAFDCWHVQASRTLRLNENAVGAFKLALLVA